MTPRGGDRPAKCWTYREAAGEKYGALVGDLPALPDSPWSDGGVGAVERALDDRQREATGEVERILAAAVRVMEQVAPERGGGQRYRGRGRLV